MKGGVGSVWQAVVAKGLMRQWPWEDRPFGDVMRCTCRGGGIDVWEGRGVRHGRLWKLYTSERNGVALTHRVVWCPPPLVGLFTESSPMLHTVPVSVCPS